MSVNMDGLLFVAFAMVGGAGPVNMVLATSGARFGRRHSMPLVADARCVEADVIAHKDAPVKVVENAGLIEICATDSYNVTAGAMAPQPLFSLNLQLPVADAPARA